MIYTEHKPNIGYEDFLLVKDGYQYGKTLFPLEISVNKISNCHLIIPEISPLTFKFLKQMINQDKMFVEIVMIKTGINLIFSDEMEFDSFIFFANARYSITFTFREE